jgi:RND family efflux transporter MFP subunit
MNTRLHPTLVAMLLTAQAILISCTGEKKETELKKVNPVSVQVGIPARQNGQQITVSGQITSQEIAVISTRVMGFVSSIKVKPGDLVQKGELLVTISSGDVLAKRAQAQAMISEVEAALKDAQKDYERFGELFQQQSASAKEFENATLRYHSVKAKAEAAEQMKNEVNSQLSYTNLVAPFTGVVTQKNMDEGGLANPGMSILIIEQSHNFFVRASVSEDEVGKLKTGMDAKVHVKSTGKIFQGKVFEISPSSQNTGGQYQIKVTVPEFENTGLFSGMYVNVLIDLKNLSTAESAWVPSSSVIRKDQLSGLYTISEDQTAQLRWVKTGKVNGNAVEILSGLRPGEKFIIQSDGRLYSGVPVLVK